MLYKKYTIILDDKNPDYVIYSCFGNNHLKYNDRVMIYLTHENDIPDFNFCDYAIGYPHLTYADRYLRMHNAMYHKTFDLSIMHTHKTPEELLDRKFCNFVYSNNLHADPMRKSIFDDFLQKARERYFQFYQHIFDQSLEKAMRRTRYGRASSFFLPPLSFPLRVKNRLKRMC